MRLVFVALVLALAFPPSASAGAAIVLEGTELVYRTDPGQDDDVQVGTHEGAFAIRSAPPVAIQAPCSLDPQQGVRCDAAGVTAVRVFTGDGEDNVVVFGTGAEVTVDLGPGDDESFVYGVGASEILVVGGEGDDEFVAGPEDRAVRFVCGPGADSWRAGARIGLGDGCAPNLTGVTPRTVLRTFREGRLSGPASGSVTLKRTDQRRTVARGTFEAPEGPLQVNLEPTKAAHRWLKRHPRLPVFVAVRTRIGNDRGEMRFSSRLATDT